MMNFILESNANIQIVDTGFIWGLPDLSSEDRKKQMALPTPGVMVKRWRTCFSIDIDMLNRSSA
jgi:hypothetical protein